MDSTANENDELKAENERLKAENERLNKENEKIKLHIMLSLGGEIYLQVQQDFDFHKN